MVGSPVAKADLLGVGGGGGGIDVLGIDVLGSGGTKKSGSGGPTTQPGYEAHRRLDCAKCTQCRHPGEAPSRASGSGGGAGGLLSAPWPMHLRSRWALRCTSRCLPRPRLQHRRPQLLRCPCRRSPLHRPSAHRRRKPFRFRRPLSPARVVRSHLPIRTHRQHRSRTPSGSGTWST